MTTSHDLVQFYSNRCRIGDAPPSRVSAPGQFGNIMDLNGEPIGDSLVPYDVIPLRSSRVQPAISSEELGIGIELEGKERAEDGGKT